MEKDKTMIVYFTSGQSLKLSFSDKKLQELIASLKNWNSSVCVGNECGINFSHVTHYIIEE